MMLKRLKSVVGSDYAPFVVAAVGVSLLFVSKLGAYDLWWHLRAGEMILQGGGVPHSDPFSFTAYGQPWTYHSWLSGVVLCCVYRLGGLPALTLLRAALVTCSLMLAWQAARKRGVSAPLASVLVLVCAMQLQTRALTRPYLFSFVLFAMFYLLMQDVFRRRERKQKGGDIMPPDGDFRSVWRQRRFLWGPQGRLLLLPALMLAWANLHAGFFCGLLLIGAFGAGEMAHVALNRPPCGYLRALFRADSGARFRALLLTGMLCVAASLVTPYGPGTFLYPFKLLFGVRMVREIQEWQRLPASADFVVMWAALAIYPIVFVRAVRFCAKQGELRRRIGEFATDAFLVAGFGALAISSVRNLSWFLLVLPPVLGHHVRLTHASGQDDRGRAHSAAGRRLYLGMACVLAIVLIARRLSAPDAFGFGVARDRFPVYACDWLEKEGLYLRAYNTYEWGGYLIWRLGDRMKVFVDGRSLLYGDEIMGQASVVAKGEPTWQSVLDRWQVQMLIVRYRKRDSGHFFRTARWRCVYWDDVCLIALSREALEQRETPLETFPLSNPAVFEDSLAAGRVEGILAELERIIRRQPQCWTAHVFRARCMLRLAEQDPENANAHLARALQGARKAVEINDGTAETWTILGECYQKLDKNSEAEKALRKARRLR